MKNIRPILVNASPDDARSALYYLNRYLKQAAIFKDYEKDFFADDFKSKPSNEVCDLTNALIRYIENESGRSAATFEDSLYMSWTDHIDDVERELDPDPSGDTVQKAMDFIKSMELPPTKQ
jgi:hypothetical protein